MSHVKGWNPETGKTKTHDEMNAAEKAACAGEILRAQRENLHGRIIPIDFVALDLAKRLAAEAEDEQLVIDIDAAVTAARLAAGKVDAPAPSPAPARKRA
jgi:hypothetical protein